MLAPDTVGSHARGNAAPAPPVAGSQPSGWPNTTDTVGLSITRPVRRAATLLDGSLASNSCTPIPTDAGLNQNVELLHVAIRLLSAATSDGV